MLKIGERWGVLAAPHVRSCLLAQQTGNQASAGPLIQHSPGFLTGLDGILVSACTAVAQHMYMDFCQCATWPPARPRLPSDACNMCWLWATWQTLVTDIDLSQISGRVHLPVRKWCFPGLTCMLVTTCMVAAYSLLLQSSVLLLQHPPRLLYVL